jgi:hypothetical protein
LKKGGLQVTSTGLNREPEGMEKEGNVQDEEKKNLDAQRREKEM